MPNQVHIDIYSLFLLVGAFQGIFFASLLYFMNRQRQQINQHMSIILASFGLLIFHLFLIETGYIYQLQFLTGFAIPFDVLAGPSIYCYIRCITRPDLNNSNKSLFRHYAIILVQILLLMPYWPLDFETKLRLYEGGFSLDSWPENLHANLYGLMTVSATTYSIYLYLSVKMLIEHKRRIREVFSYQEKITLNWLSNLLKVAGFFLVLMFIYISILIFDDKESSILALRTLGFTTTLAVFYIGVMVLKQPRIYRHKDSSFVNTETASQEPSSNELDPITVTTDESIRNEVGVESLITDKKKYKKSALSINDLERIAGKVSCLMDEEQLFLTSDLTMPKLASRLSVSPNYLSQTINTVFKESFFDFINRQRIEYSKALLKDKSKIDNSILDIAMESAFNSKSAFYVAFKKNTGMTPVQFRLG